MPVLEELGDKKKKKKRHKLTLKETTRESNPFYGVCRQRKKNKRKKNKEHDEPIRTWRGGPAGMNPEGCSVGGERVLSPSTQTTSCGLGRGSGPKGALGQTKSSMISPGGCSRAWGSCQSH